MPITVLGLDADDTLWHNETFYQSTRQRFNELLAGFVDAKRLEEEIEATERRNLGLYGYGAKGFTLSMMETALQVSNGKVSGHALGEILAIGRELMNHPVEPLPGVHEALEVLSAEYKLVLITKGDLFHQESKVAASGVAELFENVEIVAEKDPATYSRVITRMGGTPVTFCMVGNSVRSDIAPVLELGGAGVHVPYHVTWALEDAEVEESHPRLARIAGIREAPAAIADLARSA